LATNALATDAWAVNLAAMRFDNPLMGVPRGVARSRGTGVIRLPRARDEVFAGETP
jgi:hypothetical protein